MFDDVEGFWYLATPYTKMADRDHAADVAAFVTGTMMKKGLKVFSPIAHSHFVCHNTFGLDALNHDFWMNQCKPFIEAAGGLIVVIMKGWDESVGVKQEIELFKQMKKPILCFVKETQQFVHSVDGGMEWFRLD